MIPSIEMLRIRGFVVEACIAADMHQWHDRIRVRWNTRLESTMAQAYLEKGWKTGVVEINPAIWAVATIDHRRETTFHEVAHILTDVTSKVRCVHGPAWKAMMARMGYPNPAIYHDLDVTKALAKVGRKRRRRRR